MPEKTITTKVMLTRPRAMELHKEAKQVGPRFFTIMRELKEDEGWRALGFDSWGHYLDEEWPGTRQNMHNLLIQDKVQENIGAPLPVTHALELNKLPATEQKDAYNEAVMVAVAVEKPKPTAEVVAEVVKNRLQPSVDSQGVSAEKQASKKRSDKVEASLDRLEKVIGKREIEAIRDGTISIPDKELIEWAAMTDGQVEALKDLVISKRFMPTVAHRLLNQTIDEHTKIRSLNLLATKGPFRVQVDGFTTITFNRRNFKDAEKKIEKLLGIEA